MTAQPELSTKHCTACGEEKPLSEFSPRTGRQRQRHSYCKPCMAERTRVSAARRREEMGEEAWLEYQRGLTRKFRQNPANRRKDRLHRQAQSRAISDLKRLYPDVYRKLLDRHRYELGLD